MKNIDTSQWVVVLSPKNRQKDFYSIRLFKNVDIATSHYGKASRTAFIYTSSGEMVNRMTAPKMQEYLRDITLQFANEKEQYKSSVIAKDKTIFFEENSTLELIKYGNREALAKGLWALCHLLGDQVHGIPDSPDNEDKFKIRLDKLTSDEGRAVWTKLPRQAQVICQGLIDLNEQVVEEIELHQLVKSLVSLGKLKTKQDPVAIWRYYAPTLGDHGFLFYPGKRHKLESHTEEMSGI